MKFDLPGGPPALAAAVNRTLRQQYSFPVRLWPVATADLPTASSDNAGGIAWNSTASIITWSNGSAWIQPSLSTHVHAASAITFAPAGNIAATNVQAAIEELDTEKLASSSYTAADVLAKLLTVDGSGSGLDADLLDGQSGAFYLARANHTGTQAWGTITGTPTTLAGYGITDAQPLDGELTAIAGLASAADRLPYFTGSGTAALATFTAAGRSIVAAADATAQRELLRNACMVKKAADQTGANYTVATSVAWDSEVYDDNGWHDNATNNSRLTVPAGVTRVRVGASVRMANVAAGSLTTLTLTKNGSSSFDGAISLEQNADSTAPRLAISSGPISATATDYFEVQLTVGTDTSIDVPAARSNFWIEAC